MLSAETQHLTTELDLKDGLSGGLAKAQGALGRFTGAAHKGFGDVGKGAGQLAGGLFKVGALAGTVAVGGLAAAAKMTANFTDQMNVINTIAQTTPDGLKKIGDGIKDLSADTGADLTDLTGAYYDLLSAGVKVEDAQGMLTNAYKLGRGALASTGEAVDFLTTAINAYSLKGTDAARVSDMFAQAVADGKVKLSEISSSFADVAPIASQYGIGLEEVAASYGMLTAKGNTAGAVTTQMARAITELAKPSGPLKALEQATGKSYIALAGKEGLVSALQQARVDAKANGIAFIDLFGRQEAYKYAVQTTGKNLKDYNAEQQKIIGSNGTMDKQYGERNQGLAFQFGRLSANVKLAALAIGEGFAPALGRAADKLTAFLRDNKDELVGLGKDIGKFIDGIDFKALLDGAKTFGGLLGQALNVLKLIPPEVSIAVAGFLGINKLSGGLIGEGIKNIGGGLIGGLTRGITSKVPILNQFTAQPVRVVNWNEAGLGGLGGVGGAAGGASGWMGKLMGGLKIAGAVTIAGASIAALAEQFGTFMQTTQQAQADLQEKADQASLQSGDEALANLKNLNQKLGSLQGFDRVLADTFGGKQEVEALSNLSDAVTRNGKMSSADITDAIKTLQGAQKEALARGNQTVADHIGQNIKTLQARLATATTTAATKTTTAINQTKGAILNGDRTQTGVLNRIAAQPTQVSVTVPVSTSVSVRDVETRTNTTSRYGFVAK